jgi:hypothetical protein
MWSFYMYIAPQFTLEGQELFKRRYENGYDLTNDQKYNQWLRCYHPGRDQSACVGESESTYTRTCTFQVGVSKIPPLSPLIRHFL